MDNPMLVAVRTLLKETYDGPEKTQAGTQKRNLVVVYSEHLKRYRQKMLHCLSTVRQSPHKQIIPAITYGLRTLT